MCLCLYNINTKSKRCKRTIKYLRPTHSPTLATQNKHMSPACRYHIFCVLYLTIQSTCRWLHGLVIIVVPQWFQVNQTAHFDLTIFSIIWNKKVNKFLLSWWQLYLNVLVQHCDCRDMTRRCDVSRGLTWILVVCRDVNSR